MNEEVRSVLFSIGLDDAEVESAEVATTESKLLGTYTEPKYICAQASLCGNTTCKHSKPHKEDRYCRSRWESILRMSADNSRDSIEWFGGRNWAHYYSYGRGRFCANCVSIIDSRKFKPFPKAKLAEHKGKVICPSAIPSCVGRCMHAEPHVKNKFCKDLVPDDSIKLQCRSVSSNRHGGARGVLFDAPKLPCHV